MPGRILAECFYDIENHNFLYHKKALILQQDESLDYRFNHLLHIPTYVFPITEEIRHPLLIFRQQLKSDFLLFLLAPGFHLPRLAVPFGNKILSLS